MDVHISLPQSPVAIYSKLKLIASPHANAGKAGIVPILSLALQPSAKLKPADQVAYADAISDSTLHDPRLTADGQLTLNGVDADTANVDVHISTPQSPVAVYSKLKLIASPHANVGKAGILAILSLALQPSAKLKPADQVAYADAISDSTLHDPKLTADGQLTLNGVEAATANVDVHISLSQSPVAV